MPWTLVVQFSPIAFIKYQLSFRPEWAKGFGVGQVLVSALVKLRVKGRYEKVIRK